MFDRLVEKIHFRTGALLLAALFAVAGMLMVFSGIRDEGFIDLQSAVVNGKIKSGLVGVSFAFLGALIVLVCTIRRPVVQKLKIQKGAVSIEYEGTVNSPRAMLNQMESMVKLLTVENAPASTTKENSIANCAATGP